MFINTVIIDLSNDFISSMNQHFADVGIEGCIYSYAKAYCNL